jgi:hypothetical protein
MIYCYSTVAGEVFEKSFPMGEAPRTISLGNGKIAERDFAAEHDTPRKCGAGWPIECLGSAVHPSQAQGLRDHFKKNGVDVQVNNSGQPIYENAQQRKRALKCRGLHDLNSFN